MHRARNIATAGMILLFSGCAGQPSTVSGLATPENASVGYSPDASSCVARLASSDKLSDDALDADDISIVNWNIHKGSNPTWVSDLQDIDRNPDILILQEASPQLDAWDVLATEHHQSFAAGFRRKEMTTGVMTISAVEPLTECNLVAHEPWFKTRKATLVTEYALSGTDQTLLVVNIHGINFSFGIQDVRDQFRQAHSIIDSHTGPVLFSGDFNTWRNGRTRMVADIAGDLGLSPLVFDEDHRKRFMGSPLDHIYVRGLDTISSTTEDLESSDHNPMLVQLRYVQQVVARWEE